MRYGKPPNQQDPQHISRSWNWRREVSSKTTYSILLQYLILIRHPVSFPLPKLASGSTSFFSYLRYSRLRDVMIKGLYTAQLHCNPLQTCTSSSSMTSRYVQRVYVVEMECLLWSQNFGFWVLALDWLLRYRFRYWKRSNLGTELRCGMAVVCADD